MPEPLVPSIGTSVLHLFCVVTDDADRAAVEVAVNQATEAGMQVIPVAMLGHKADVAFMVIGPDLWDLKRFQTAVLRSGLEIVDSYVSITEQSEYAQGLPEHMVQARLYPVLPPEGMRAWCFYPMSKRRDPEQNWYDLPFDERKEMMMEHSISGRKFAGRIIQLITGSAGLDDFEWGVTLFGQKLDDLKEVVYTMRYDRASTHYAEFGTFYTGGIGTLGEVLDAAGVRP